MARRWRRVSREDRCRSIGRSVRRANRVGARQGPSLWHRPPRSEAGNIFLVRSGGQLRRRRSSSTSAWPRPACRELKDRRGCGDLTTIGTILGTVQDTWRGTGRGQGRRRAHRHPASAPALRDDYRERRSRVKPAMSSLPSSNAALRWRRHQPLVRSRSVASLGSVWGS
jgi:hypothetical protein